MYQFAAYHPDGEQHARGRSYPTEEVAIEAARRSIADGEVRLDDRRDSGFCPGVYLWCAKTKLHAYVSCQD